MGKEAKFVKVGGLYHQVISERDGQIECAEQGLTETQVRDFYIAEALKYDPLAQEYHLKLMNLKGKLSELGNFACDIVANDSDIISPDSKKYNEPFATLYKKIMSIYGELGDNK